MRQETRRAKGGSRAIALFAEGKTSDDIVSVGFCVRFFVCVDCVSRGLVRGRWAGERGGCCGEGLKAFKASAACRQAKGKLFSVVATSRRGGNNLAPLSRLLSMRGARLQAARNLQVVLGPIACLQRWIFAELGRWRSLRDVASENLFRLGAACRRFDRV